jgi:hypothetical protein
MRTSTNRFQAGIQSGQQARSTEDRVWITPAGYEAFNPADSSPVYNWELISINPDSGPFSPVLVEEVDACVTFSQAVEISQAFNEMEQAAGGSTRYCVRRSQSGAAGPIEVVVDLPF